MIKFREMEPGCIFIFSDNPSSVNIKLGKTSYFDRENGVIKNEKVKNYNIMFPTWNEIFYGIYKENGIRIKELQGRIKKVK